MPDPDGKRTSLASYTWGGWGSQNDITRFRDVFQPDRGSFSPSYPLVPPEREQVRLWDYPVGYNAIYTPRSYEAIGFDELRALAESHDITRLAIETRKDQIEKLDWTIKSRNEKTPGEDAAWRIDQLTDFWRSPDGERPFATWLREALEDVLVLDAAAFELRRNRGGKIIGLDVVDGSTVKVLLDDTGLRTDHSRATLAPPDQRRADVPTAEPAAAQGVRFQPRRADRDDGQYRAAPPGDAVATFHRGQCSAWSA